MLNKTNKIKIVTLKDRAALAEQIARILRDGGSLMTDELAIQMGSSECSDLTLSMNKYGTSSPRIVTDSEIITTAGDVVQALSQVEI